MFCCSAASTAYVQAQNGSYTFLVCQESAQAVFEACKSLSGTAQTDPATSVHCSRLGISGPVLSVTITTVTSGDSHVPGSMPSRGFGFYSLFPLARHSVLAVSTGSIFGSISIGSVVGDPQQLLSYLFQGFAATFLPGVSITAQVVNGSVSAWHTLNTSRRLLLACSSEGLGFKRVPVCVSCF